MSRIEMSLVLYGDPVLNQRAKEIARVDQKTIDIAQCMIEVMDEHCGMGLAAPQVGISKRIIIVRAAEDKDPVALVNPRITSRTGIEEKDEGCLSIPGIVLSLKRAKQIRITGKNLSNEDVAMEAGGFVARAFQHEVDHLDGILIVNRIGKKQLRSIATHLEEIKRGEVSAGLRR